MSFKELKSKFDENIKKVNVDNNVEIYNLLEASVKNYRDKGGKGKILYEFLWIQYSMYEGNDIKQDIFGDIMNKMSNYCSPNQSIHFKDIDFKLFNRKTGKFQKNISRLG